MYEMERFRIDEIAKLHCEIYGAFKTTLEKAIRIGEILTEQKQNLRHGEFTSWVENNLPFTVRTAQIYMRVYAERDRLKSETGSLLDFKSASRLLIDHKGPKESVHSVPLGVFSVLKKCQRFTSNREFDPGALKCFKFKGNRIMAMDRHRGIVYELDNGYDFDEFVTLSNFLVRVSSHLGRDAEFKVEEDHIKIEDGKFRTKIPLYREKHPFPEFKLDNSKSLPGNFFDAVKKVYFAVCKDTSKERCRGVLLDKNTLYATDTHRIVRYTTDFETDSGFVVPDDLLEIVLTEEDIPESYAIVDDKFWFLFKDHKAFASRVKEPFPNCERDFNSLPKHDTYCTFEKSAMSSALKRMQPFCEGPMKKMDVKVEERRIIFQSHNRNGEAEEEIECEHGGDWGTFSVSHDLFESCATRMSRFQYTGDFLYFQEGGLECLLTTLD